MRNKNRVCPVEIVDSLDSKIRRWLQNPVKILQPYIKEGIKVLDVDCGHGFFTIPISELVGKNGKVIAADLQAGMLRKLQEKIRRTDPEERIKLHKCEQDKIGLTEKVDFILAFYMVHEVPNQDNFLRELKSLLNTRGALFIVEPKLFHVTKKEFAETVRKVKLTGLKVIDYSRLFLSWAVLLRN